MRRRGRSGILLVSEKGGNKGSLTSLWPSREGTPGRGKKIFLSSQRKARGREMICRAMKGPKKVLEKGEQILRNKGPHDSLVNRELRKN